MMRDRRLPFQWRQHRLQLLPSLFGLRFGKHLGQNIVDHIEFDLELFRRSGGFDTLDPVGGSRPHRRQQDRINVALGLVEIEKLKSFRGYFVVVAFIIAAVITPPDVISQLALAIPMCWLYEIGILGAGWFRKVSRAPDAEETAGTDVDKPADSQ